ncbi:MAG: ABC transporter permease [Gemmatimonadetes bacterium]|nr:ABC transporter permease [Gemmatimonadota bacterium]
MKKSILPWLALRNLGREVRRSALTASAMALGLALLIFSRTLSDGAHDDWVTSGVRLGSGHVIVEGEGYRDSGSLDDRFGEGDLVAVTEAVTSIPGIDEATTRLEVAGLASSTEGAVPVRILGVEPEAELGFSRFGGEPRSGRYLQEGDRLHAFVGEKLARRLAMDLNARFVLTAQGASGDIEGQLVRLVGTYQTGLDELDEGLVHIPMATARDWLGVGEAATSVSLLLTDEAETEPVVQALRQELLGRPVSVLGWHEAMPELDSLIKLDDAGDWVFHGILFAIVALAILNAVFMSVLQRRRELGLLHSLGLSRLQTGAVVFLEGVFITAASGLVGMVLGFAVVWLFFRDGLDFSSLMPGDYTFSGVVMNPVLVPVIEMKHVLQSLFFMGLIGVAASLYPAWVAGRLDPAEAVKAD